MVKKLADTYPKNLRYGYMKKCCITLKRSVLYFK